MSEPIKVGDLVVQVSECCSHDSELGEVYRVGEVKYQRTRCDGCGYEYHGLVAFDVEHPSSDWWGAPPITWLKKIPPLSELEGEKRKEELTA